jgi:hypothetical protein
LEHRILSRTLVLGIIALAVILGVSSYPNAYAWNASPKISYQDIAGALAYSSPTVNVIIQFDFSAISKLPSTVNYPTEYQLRKSTDGGSSWTEIGPKAISSTPTSTVFTVQYNLGAVSQLTLVQARLNSNLKGWSDWGPDNAVPVPEFPFSIIALASVTVGALALFRSKRRVTG